MDQTPSWIGDRHITIHNDDSSSFAGVTEILRRCLGCDQSTAEAWARHIHKQGEARFGPWIDGVATQIHRHMLALAPKLYCPNLRIEIEDAESTRPPPVLKREPQVAWQLLGSHFEAWSSDDLLIVKREFPAYLRVDVLRVIDQMTANAQRVGIHSRHRHEGSDLATLVSERQQPKLVGALQFEDLDIGEDQPLRLPSNCLSLIRDGEVPLALWVSLRGDYGETPAVVVEILAPPGAEAAARISALIDAIERSVSAGRSYRGKILSLEASEGFRGLSANALTVHARQAVSEHELVLPTAVRQALEKHLICFAAQRKALKALNQSARKGVLLYGPPGTGKTHTIRYLAHRLSDHTTFLVTAEQVGLIAVYFRLARLFAPSIIVIEDADLIAREREQLQSACDESMLNRLLNEMDGLRADAEIFVIMTTNRPQSLEAALVQRPGRIDHAIEVPVPDAQGRRLLLALYGEALRIDESALDQLVSRTEGVSAAFVKELARRLAQQSIQSARDGAVFDEDVIAVLEEMLTDSNALNLRLMGGMANDYET